MAVTQTFEATTYMKPEIPLHLNATATSVTFKIETLRPSCLEPSLQVYSAQLELEA